MSVKSLNLKVKTPVDTELLSPEAILVRDTLLEHGLETPMIENGLSAEAAKNSTAF